MSKKLQDDVLIDVAPIPTTYIIPESNHSRVSLERKTVGDIHYFEGTAIGAEDFYFEISFKPEQRPKYSSLDFMTWSYQPLVGSLSYQNIVYVHDPIGDNPISKDGSITIGFGLRSFKEHGEDYLSVFYMKDKEHGKEIVKKEPFPVDLYPAIRLEQSSLDVTIINSTSGFKYHNCRPIQIPHRSPVGLIKCSPDRRYAACYSGKDTILSVWRLYNEPGPELVHYISVPDFDFKASEEPDDALTECPFEQFTLAVSNTVGGELPQLALSRYHEHLDQEDWLFCFLNTEAKHRPFRMGNIVGHLHLLDDGKTLLVLGVDYLFVVNMKSQSLIYTFNAKHLDINASVLFSGSRLVLSENRQLPLQPLGYDHFLWYRGPDHVTMWHVPTGRLAQTFRLQIQPTDKYDYDKHHCLIAFYGTNGLEIFTTQTGISICKVKREADPNSMKPIGVKFVTVGDAPFLLTVDGNREEYILRIRNPLAGCIIINEILKTHTFGDRLQYSYISVDNSASLFVSIVVPLMTAVACLADKMPISSVVIESPSEVLDLMDSSTQFTLQEQSGEPSDRKIEVKQQKSSPKDYYIEISGFYRSSVNFFPQAGNSQKPTCHWLSKGRFVAVSRHAVQIINAEKTAPTKLVIEFVWCLPSLDANITGIKLLKVEGAGNFQQIKITYQHDGMPYEDIIDITQPISLKHVSRFLKYSPNVQNRTINVYKKALNQILKSAESILQSNEVEFKTKTSTFGHIIRGPPAVAAGWVGTILSTDIYRPLFYDNELWNRSALMEALDTGVLEIAEDIVKYCLKTLSKKNNGLLEPGYVAIVMGALPTIAQSKPKLAVCIAQYVSHIQLSRFLTVDSDIENDTKKSHIGVFARIEQLSKITLKAQAANSQSPLQHWWVKRQKFLLSWWNKERLPQPVHLCVSPLYGLNNYKADVSRFNLNTVNLSAFAQLAFRQSPVFDEPAFQAVVQYKWDTFARWYHLGLLFLYSSYALIYMVAVSISPSTLAIPGISYTLIVLTVVFMIVFDIRPLLMRWNSLTYWSSIYHWIDRAAFILVLVSTIATLLDNDSLVDLQAWTVLTLWMFVVFNFRVFRGLGLFFTLLINILTSLGWIATLMAAIIFGFSHAMWLLLRNAPPPSSGNPFVTIDGSLKSVWEFLSGDFAVLDGWDSGRSTDIMRVLFTFISTIVLLNVLIALLNNVYTDKQEIARKTWIRNRAEFIATVEVFMLTPKQRQNMNWFPAIVFYEVTPGKFRDYYQTVKESHPWTAEDEPDSQKKDTTVTELDLQLNNVSAEFIDNLVKSLKQNTAISAEVTDTLIKSLKQNRAIKLNSKMIVTDNEGLVAEL
ncbi:hypothetical protein BC937DRAFT_87742 [Endogone sp. FLAS-F59071]|nr:hypothetical protein BC937DRAFT_87742 [Endogone sp. FLAS-F59071]|eukprot:RUS19271.1 hypothetical protein BC937DRAFT_87742 [Endogone sp. FLAS-F59071]